MSFAPNNAEAAKDPFVRDTEMSVARIRELFKAVIEPVCGGAPKAHEIADSFNVNRKLGWQIWNVAYDREPFRAIRYMPAPRAMETWRRAAEKTGLPGDLLASLTKASKVFGALIEEHSGDSETLDLLLGSCEENLDPKAEERHRKEAYKGNSFVWGVRAETYFTTLAVHPSEREDYFDMVRLHGFHNLIRIRPNVRWPFAQAVVYSGDDERYPTRAPIDPSDSTRETGVPLMVDFCSSPVPPVQRRPGEQGFIEDELLPGPVGQTGRTTLVTGEVARELASAYKTQPGEDALFGTGVRTPCETLVFDYLVHRDLFPGRQCELRVYSELINQASRDERDLLRVSEGAQYLGRGLARLRTAEVPHYMEMMEFVFGRMNWSSGDFDHYRVRMRFPPLPVSVMFRHDLPDPPGGFGTSL